MIYVKGCARSPPQISPILPPEKGSIVPDYFDSVERVSHTKVDLGNLYLMMEGIVFSMVEPSNYSNLLLDVWSKPWVPR